MVSVSQAAHRGSRILVVDDEENVRLSLAVILQKKGYMVETASGGREAIARIACEPFDLVLTDLSMKDADGLEVLAAVRREQPETIGIVLTGFASLDSAIEAIRRGAYDYLAKPANVEDMLLTIERGLERRRLAIDLKRRNEELDTLNRLAHLGVGKALQSTKDLGTALAQVLDIVRELFAPAGGTALFAADLPGTQAIRRAGSPAGEAMLESLLLVDLAQSVLLSGVPITSHAEFPAVMVLPVESSGTRYGTVAVCRVNSLTWTEEQILTARTIAGRIAITLENARLLREIVDERESLRWILNAVADGVLGLDAEGRILFFNRGASRLTGRSEASVQGVALETILVPGSVDDLSQLRLRALESREGLAAGELRLVAADGSELPCDAMCSMPRGRTGAVRWVLALRDARERRKLEEQKNSVFSHLTHELKTPLTSILAYADLLDREKFGALTALQRDALAAMRRGGRQLELLIENILGIARVRDGSLDPRLEPVDLAVVLEEARHAFSPIAAERGIEFAVEGDGGAITADRKLVTMALNNLLFNAFKYTQRGGRVRLACSRSGGGGVLVEVADTGVGIPEEFLDRIFQPHFQVDPSRGGSGLGLAIVRSVAEAHGGNVRVESRSGEGSRFLLSLGDKR